MEARFDAAIVRRWASNAVELLAKHREELNALNVFPIPDGDTGTNLFLTFKAAAQAESDRTGSVDDLSDAFRALAQGALLGARGNSGVILAQTLQGFSTYVDEVEKFELSAFFQAGAIAARKAVAVPQEGTALTVLDAVANAQAKEPKLASEVAREALKNTPEMLPALKQAGVVDAGGRGVVLLLDALVSAWYESPNDSLSVGFVPDSVPQQFDCKADGKFELMFVVPTLVVTEISEKIAKMGKSLVVTSGQTLTQIHIHLDEPENAIAMVREIANPKHIRIELLKERPSKRALIVQAYGSGIVAKFADIGALVVPCEPNQRASVSDFVDAAMRSNASEIVLVSADLDTIQVLELAAKVIRKSGTSVAVVKAQTIPQAISAVSLFDESNDLQGVANQMQATTELVTTLAITKANRVSSTPIGKISEGDYLLLVESEIVGFGKTLSDLFKHFETYTKDRSFASVIWGIDVLEEDKVALLAQLSGLETIQINGQQEIWQVLVGLE